MPQKTGTRIEPWSRRPHFAARQLLTAHQLNAANDDELERQRLLNRALHGYGIIYGYGLTVDEHGLVNPDRGCVDISAGLGFDRHGRMLYWGGGLLAVGDIVGPPPDCEGTYTLRVHYAEREDPRDDCGYCDIDHAIWREQGVVFSLTLDWTEADRSCPEHPDGDCISHGEYLCQRTGGMSGPEHKTVPPAEDLQWVDTAPGPLHKTVNGEWRYDPRLEVAIPVARLEVCDRTKNDEYSSEYEPDCDPIYEFCRSRSDACQVRPLVYRNPLLYELLNCCDVDAARIYAYSWDVTNWHWPEVAPWDEFVARALADEPEAGFTIRFSKPIHARTIHPGSIFITAMYHEDRTDYWMGQRIPIAELRLLDSDGEYARGVQIIIDRQEWIPAELTGKRSTLDQGFRFELTVRGQLLRDNCGNMLNARPVDIDAAKRCQDRPGGDFLSVFEVGPRSRGPYYYESGDEGADE